MEREERLPVYVRIIYDWNGKESLLLAEEYGHDGQGVYYKAKRPGGGTVEVHVLEQSYFDGWPDSGEDG